MFGYATELRSCTEVTFLGSQFCTDSTLLALFFVISKFLVDVVVIAESCATVCSGKRGVHHGLQQVSALPARHTGGAHPQAPGSYGAAARQEEQVEELRRSAATHPVPPPLQVTN